MDLFNLMHRARNGYWKILSIVIMPRLFRSFGKGSVLNRPLQVRGASHIRIGRNVIINPFAWLFASDTAALSAGDKQVIISIGDNVYIGHFVHIAAVDCVTINDNVLIADKVYISDHNHRYGPNENVRYSGTESKGPVTIGKGAWIGEGVCILPGVKIGDGAVIGANAVVTKSIPPRCVAAGVPARIIRRLV